MDWIINSLRVTWAVKSVWPTIVTHHLRPECECQMFACETAQKHRSRPHIPQRPRIITPLSFTGHPWLIDSCIAGTEESWVSLEINLWFAHEFPLVFRLLKWQKRVWIHSVACGAPAGLLHRLPQSWKVRLSEGKQTWVVLSEYSRVKGSAGFVEEGGLTEGRNRFMGGY